MEIDKIKEHYTNIWKQKFEELNELTKFIHTLDN